MVIGSLSEEDTWKVRCEWQELDRYIEGLGEKHFRQKSTYQNLQVGTSLAHQRKGKKTSVVAGFKREIYTSLFLQFLYHVEQLSQRVLKQNDDWVSSSYLDSQALMKLQYMNRICCGHGRDRNCLNTGMFKGPRKNPGWFAGSEPEQVREWWCHLPKRGRLREGWSGRAAGWDGEAGIIFKFEIPISMFSSNPPLLSTLVSPCPGPRQHISEIQLLLAWEGRELDGLCLSDRMVWSIDLLQSIICTLILDSNLI